MKAFQLHKAYLCSVVFFWIPFGVLVAQQFPPEHPIALYRRGLEYQRAGDFYRAIEFFRAASLRNPSYFEPVFASAELFFQLGEYDEAIRLVNTSLQLRRTSVPAQVLKARILVGQGQFQEASELYSALLTREPNNLEARLGKAELDIALGRHRSAALQYIDTLRRFPDNRRALLSLGILLAQQGNIQEAEVYFNTALRHHADSPQVHLLVGEHFFNQKRYDRAIERVKTALSIQPDSIEAYQLLGWISFQRGNYMESYEYMTRILSLNRNNPSAWYLKALSALRMARRDEGIRLLRSLVVIAPEDEVARITLEDTLRELLPIEHPTRKIYAEYRFDRGDKFQERNLFQRALEEYRRGLQIDPYSLQGRLSYAAMKNMLGFPSYAYNSLVFLKRQNIVDRRVIEQLEIEENIQSDRTSRKWNVDQFALRRPVIKFSVFVDTRSSALVHRFSEVYFARYLSDILMGNPAIEIPFAPMGVETFAEAFQEARQRRTDFFVLFTLMEYEREIAISADVFLSRTGGRIDSFSVYRTGNDRIHNAMMHISAILRDRIPIRGELLRRDFERGLASVGTVDGVEEGDRFHILPSRSVELSNDSFGFVYAKREILGTFTVTEVDDLVSEGTIQRTGFFDRINPGDTLIPYQEPKPETKTPSIQPPTSPLFRRILRLQ